MPAGCPRATRFSSTPARRRPWRPPGERRTKFPPAIPGDRARPAPHPTGAPLPLKEARSRFEREYVLGALVRAQWNQTRAAEALGVNRNTLIAKMKEYELRSPKALKRD